MGRVRRRRRVWADDEKRRIVAQTRVPGVSVSQVARRYDVNANLVFKWLRDPRFKPGEEACPFLPVEVIAEPPRTPPDAASTESKIEITLSNGHRVSISGAFDPDALSRLLRGLS
ncbi:MAG: transposase [Rhodospirillales bacterium]